MPSSRRPASVSLRTVSLRPRVPRRRPSKGIRFET
ncbi:hypothetical protein SMACR_02316 [Sordaria macrospora]|uniref:Uncharacterized protein n=1 Tax=Sordaria macrospora TaxID=5147 RepID=A0A8S8ZYF1_SORMA|nr:hypothetical protein SMACR_02316 [Sordaria macrospora]